MVSLVAMIAWKREEIDVLGFSLPGDLVLVQLWPFGGNQNSVFVHIRMSVLEY